MIGISAAVHDGDRGLGGLLGAERGLEPLPRVHARERRKRFRAISWTASAFVIDEISSAMPIPGCGRADGVGASAGKGSAPG